MGGYLPRYVAFVGWFGVWDWMVLADIVSDLGDDLREPPAFHDEMEKRLKMDF